MVIYFYHGYNGLDGFMSYLRTKHKPEKPLGEDGGRCPDAMLPLRSYKRALNAQTESISPPSLQKVTILAKAINRNKPSPPDNVALL